MSHRNKETHDSCEMLGTCWYTLWYFWLGVLLVTILLCGALLFCYIYFSSKQRHRVSPHGLSHLPIAPGPPNYDEPTHYPPSYSAAMKNNRQQRSSISFTIRHCLPGHIADHEQTHALPC